MLIKQAQNKRLVPPVMWDNIGVTPDELNRQFNTSFTEELPPEKRVTTRLLLDKETNKQMGAS